MPTQPTSDGNLDPSDQIESKPIICERCGKQPFPHLVIETYQGITQLRADGGLVRNIEIDCPHCGHPFRYHINYKHIEKMTLLYAEFLRKHGVYLPE